MTVSLNIPIVANGTTKKVTFSPRQILLGDSYQQLTGSELQEPTIEWQFTSAYLTYSDIDTYVQQLKLLAGGIPFFLDIGGSIGSVTVNCLSYTIDYSGANTGQLILSCVEVSGGELLDLKADIPVTGFPTRLLTALNHITINSRTLSNADSNYLIMDTGTYLFPHNFFTEALFDYGYDVDNPTNIARADEQITGIKALIDIYRVTLSNTALTLAQNAINLGLWAKFFPTVSSPSGGSPSYNPPTNTAENWLPSIAYALRGNVPASTSQGNQTFPEIFYGFQQGTFTFTRIGTTQNYQATIASDLMSVGTVYDATSGVTGLTGRNLYAPAQDSSTNRDILFYVSAALASPNNFVTSYKNGTYLIRGSAPISGTYSVGTLVLTLPSNLTASSYLLTVSYSVANTSVSQFSRMDLFPMPRPVLSTEYSFSFENVNELIGIHDELYQITGQNKYNVGSVALQANILRALQVNNRLVTQTFNIFTLNTSGGSWDGGMGYTTRSISPAPNPTPFRDGAGRIAATITGYSVNSFALLPNEYWISSTAIYPVWTRNTTMSVSISSSISAIYKVTLQLSQTGSRTTLYQALVKIPANTETTVTLNYADFKLLEGGDERQYIWIAGRYKNGAYLNNGSPQGGETFILDYINVLMPINNPTGITFTNPLVADVTLIQGTSPRRMTFNLTREFSSFSTLRNEWMIGTQYICYRLITGTLTITARQIPVGGTGVDIKTYFLTDSTPGDWKYRAIQPSEWIPENSLTPAFNPNIPVLDIFFENKNLTTGNTLRFQLYFIGAIPQTLPVTCQVFETSIVDYNNESHTFSVGDWVVNNGGNDYLDYTPGLVPLRFERDGGSIGWQSEPTISNQFAHSLSKWQYSQLAKNVIQFYEDAQKAYTAMDSNRSSGILAPVYRWDRFAGYPKQPMRVFDFANYSYPVTLPTHHSYTHKAMLDLAMYCQRNPSDTQATRILSDFINWMYSYFKANPTQAGNPPYFYLSPADGGYQTTPGNYPNVAGSALIMQIAIYANLAGLNRLYTYRLIKYCYDFLENCYWATGSMAGTWSKNQPTVTISGNNITTHQPDQFFEPIKATALLYAQIDKLNFPTVAEFRGSYL